MSLTQTVLRSSTLAALTAPHGVDRFLEVVNPMWAAHEVRARIVSVVRETRVADDPAPVATITLQPTSTWRGHRAGQYVQLGIEIDGARRTTRAFSVSSAESGPGERITVTVRANPEGRVSSYLVERALPGEVVHLSQAAGEFTLTPEPTGQVPDRLVMITGGSGITPALSMVRTLVRERYAGQVSFVHFAQSAEHQIADEELAALARADNGIDVHLVHGELFSADLLAGLVPDHDTARAWACGPAAMIELVRAAYHGRTAPDGGDLLKVEFFTTPVLAVGGGAAEGEVAFTRSDERADNSGATLLEQAEALGLRPEYGCRMGICFSCTSRKTAGTVRNVVTGVESSEPDEDIQICVNQPVGSCAVEL